MKIVVTNFNASQKDLLENAHKIRYTVFVKEQSVDPLLEYDEYDPVSRHYLAFINSIPIGTARWRYTNTGIKLERFAVLSEYRNIGVGRQLVYRILHDLRRFPDKQIYLHAQSSAVYFYTKYGFHIIGESFLEAGIIHFQMIYKDTN